MKKIYILLFLILLSCTNTKQKENNELTSDSTIVLANPLFINIDPDLNTYEIRTNNYVDTIIANYCHYTKWSDYGKGIKAVKDGKIIAFYPITKQTAVFSIRKIK